ncbi:MAG: hypothetical protein U0573_13660 [Phycisphaerales bacterium]|nr:hypothetical protein [Planctomycetota bacterium]
MPPDPTQFDEAAAGNLLPDPELPPRALAELRAAFHADQAVPAEADILVLRMLEESTAHRRRMIGLWRGFQIAAVFVLAACLMYYGSRNREDGSTKVPSIGSRTAKADARSDAVAPASPAAAPAGASPVPTLAAANVASSNVTILDAFNLARRLENENKKFKPTGGRINEWEEVDKLAAACIDAEPAQVRELRSKSTDNPARLGLGDSAEARRSEADGLSFKSAEKTLEKAADKQQTRILSYDIMLDVGSRSLAAYQVEVSMAAPDTAHVTLIWVRGGEHPALNRQPLYNAKRLVNPPQRIAFNVANFDTGRDLPSGDIFVARVVLVVVGSGTPGVTARLVVAAGPEGVPIPAGLRVTERSPVLNPEIPRKPLDKPE